MHWVTSSLVPDTRTDLSLEPGTGKLNIRGPGGNKGPLLNQELAGVVTSGGAISRKVGKFVSCVTFLLNIRGPRRGGNGVIRGHF